MNVEQPCPAFGLYKEYSPYQKTEGNTILEVIHILKIIHQLVANDFLDNKIILLD